MSQSRQENPNAWHCVRLRNGTHARILEIVDRIGWYGWSNLPKPWRSTWAKMKDRRIPGVDSVTDLAVSALLASLKPKRRT